MGARAAVMLQLRHQTRAYLVPMCNRVDRLRLMTASPQNIDFSEIMADLQESGKYLHLCCCSHPAFII